MDMRGSVMSERVSYELVVAVEIVPPPPQD